MNIYENMRNKRKMVKNKGGGYVQQYINGTCLLFYVQTVTVSKFDMYHVLGKDIMIYLFLTKQLVVYQSFFLIYKFKSC